MASSSFSPAWDVAQSCTGPRLALALGSQECALLQMLCGDDPAPRVSDMLRGPGAQQSREDGPQGPLTGIQARPPSSCSSPAADVEQPRQEGPEVRSASQAALSQPEATRVLVTVLPARSTLECELSLSCLSWGPKPTSFPTGQDRSNQQV